MKLHSKVLKMHSPTCPLPYFLATRVIILNYILENEILIIRFHWIIHNSFRFNHNHNNNSNNAKVYIRMSSHRLFHNSSNSYSNNNYTREGSCMKRNWIRFWMKLDWTIYIHHQVKHLNLSWCNREVPRRPRRIQELSQTIERSEYNECQ